MSDCAPPEDQRISSWFPCLTEREKVVLGYNLRTKAGLLCCDLSQRIGQTPTSVNEDLNTLMPGARVWLPNLPPPHEPRLLLGREALAIQGWPLHDLADHVEWDYTMTYLAGNAISGQI